MSTLTAPAPSPAPDAVSGRREHPPASGDTVTVMGNLRVLAGGWRALDDAVRAPMQTHAWSQAGADCFAGGGSLHAIAVYRREALVAVAPLRPPVAGAPATLVGSAELFEPADLVWRDTAALTRLARAVVTAPWPVQLLRLPIASPTLPALRAAARGRATLLVRPQPPTPFATLDGACREPECRLNPGRRSDLRRARRRAEALGHVRSQLLAPAADTVDALLDEAIAVEAASWKGAARTALRDDPPRAAFFRQYARAAAHAGTLRLAFLRLDGRAIAMQLAVVAAGAFWLLKVGYDAAFAACSPGVLLLRETMREAALAGLASYEFLGLPAPWIHPWATGERACALVRVYPWHRRGLSALAADTAAAVLHHAARRAVARPRP